MKNESNSGSLQQLRGLKKLREDLSQKNFRIKTKIELYQNERKRMESKMTLVREQMKEILDKRKGLDKQERIKRRRLKRQN